MSQFCARWLWLLYVACFCSNAIAECLSADLKHPANGMTLHDVRPIIQWRGLADVEVYRVQIEARVPEGEVIEHIDVQVRGTAFRPPRPLALRRAAVKLLVSAPCEDAPPMVRETAWFYVDAARHCPPPDQLSITGPASGVVKWSPVAGATEYELEVFRLSDGQSLDRRKVTSPPAALRGGSASLLVAVRSYCGSSSGEAAYGVAPASP